MNHLSKIALTIVLSAGIIGCGGRSDGLDADQSEAFRQELRETSPAICEKLKAGVLESYRTEGQVEATTEKLRTYQAVCVLDSEREALKACVEEHEPSAGSQMALERCL